MKIIFFAISLVFQFAIAQGPVEDLNRPEFNLLRKSGQLVSVRISVGQPIKIFVVGNEEAQLDMSELKLTVRRLSPPEKNLSVKQQNNYFTIVEPLEKNTDLEVTTKIKNKTESFRFKVNTK